VATAVADAAAIIGSGRIGGDMSDDDDDDDDDLDDMFSRHEQSSRSRAPTFSSRARGRSWFSLWLQFRLRLRLGSRARADGSL